MKFDEIKKLHPEDRAPSLYMKRRITATWALPSARAFMQ
jgi:hypothetical protein